VVGIVIIVGALAAAVWHRVPPPSGTAGCSPRAVPVAVTSAETRDVPIVLTAPGTVQSWNTVSVRSQIDGKLSAVKFVEGQEVRHGDVVAEIDGRPLKATLDQAIAKKAEDEAQLAAAQKDLDRYQVLLQRQAVPRQQFDQQQAKVDQLKATVSADQVAIDGAQVQFSYATIAAPIDGRAGVRQVDPGIGATTINPKLLTRAERLQYEGYLRRKQTNAAIMALVRDAVPLKEIVRRTGHSRKLVRQVSRGDSTDVFRTRQSTLDAHLPFLDAQWSEGCRNGAELWRRLQGQGFQGSLRGVSEWTTRRRRTEKATNQQLQTVPSARTISRLMTTARDNLSKADTVTIAAIEARVPTLVEARMLVESFHAMVRKKLVADLDPWIATASLSLIASFASGIISDKAAVRAAITEPWSNGQTEGRSRN
jgi:hypothetical protein